MDAPKSAERVSMYPSDSQVSPVQSESCSTLIKLKNREMQAETQGTGGHVVHPSAWARLDTAVMFLQLTAWVCRASWLFGVQIHL